METTTMLRHAIRMVMLAALVVLTGACGNDAGEDVDSELLESADDNVATLSEDLTGGIAIGTTLRTTANLNLRTGPSTGYKVLHVIPAGASVTTVNRTTPSSGWYNIKHNGVVGWSSGAYLRVGGSSPGTARTQAIARAKSGVGFSYWWGHGRWQPGSSAHGSCSGSCPSCSHSGQNGADCSGFVAKVWVVPTTNAPVSVDSHPYNTEGFKTATNLLWHRISRGSVRIADALVHHDGGAGHIVLFESGDGWGSMWTYEARGCATGIVHNLRTVGSTYVAIARNGY